MRDIVWHRERARSGASDETTSCEFGHVAQDLRPPAPAYRSKCPMLLSTEASNFLGQKLKSYNIDCRLGRGTFGAVFTGIRKAPGGREVAAAVKVQRAENVREFSTERQCLETLQKHPHCNVIRTWAIFHDIPGHCVVLVMEAGILSLLQLQRALSTHLS